MSENLPRGEQQETEPPTLSAVPTRPPTREETAPFAGDPPRVPDYEIIRELGRGGMGVVYLARQVGLDRLAALKMILSGPHAAAAERRRFRTEAEAIARLQHPNIVQVFETGESDGRLYLVMEYCAGGTLADRLAATLPPADEAARLVECLARAVAHAHSAGIVHRDLKPANILLAGAGSVSDGTRTVADASGSGEAVKITDFGLARRLDEAAQTATGAVMGTPSYMAPEQAQGSKEIGASADVWALGAILYECLTGRPPFRAATAVDTMMQVVSDDPVPPTRLQPTVPRDLETIALKCLQKEPARRYAGAKELADDLAAFLDGRPIAARPVGAVERAVKWARRRPALTVMMAVCAALAVVSFAAISWEWRVAAAARDETHREGDRARRELDRAEESLYLNRIALAEREWRGHNIARAVRILDECPAERRDWEWGYLRKLCRGGLGQLAGHRGAVTQLASLGNERVVSAGLDGTVRRWHVPTGRQERVLVEDQPPIRAMYFAADGSRFAIGCDDGNVKVFDAEGRYQFSLRAHKGAVTALAVWKEGRQLVSGGEDGGVILCDLEQRRATVIGEHRPGVTALASHSSDGRGVLVSASGKGEVIVWDVEQFKPRSRFAVLGSVRSLALDPTGRLLTCGEAGGPVSIWEIDGGKILTLRGHAGPVRDLIHQETGIVSCGDDGSVRFWDVATEGKWTFSREVRRLHGQGGAVRVLALTTDGHLLTGGDDGLIKLWDGFGDSTARMLRDSINPVVDLAIAPDGRACASAAIDGKVRVRDLLTRQAMYSLAASGAGLTAVAFDPRGDRVACLAADHSVRLFDTKGRETARLDGHKAPAKAIAWQPGGGRLATAGQDREVILWDAGRRKVERRWEAHEGSVNGLAFHPSGERLLTGGKDGRVRVWDPASGEQVAGSRVPAGAVTHVAWSPDGKRVAAATDGGTVYLFDADLGGEPLALPGHVGTIYHVAFAPNSRRLASAGEDGLVRLWTVPGGEEVLTLRGHNSAVTCVAFTPDGRRLVSGSKDTTLRVWMGGEKGE